MSLFSGYNGDDDDESSCSDHDVASPKSLSAVKVESSFFDETSVKREILSEPNESQDDFISQSTSSELIQINSINPAPFSTSDDIKDRGNFSKHLSEEIKKDIIAADAPASDTFCHQDASTNKLTVTDELNAFRARSTFVPMYARANPSKRKADSQFPVGGNSPDAALGIPNLRHIDKKFKQSLAGAGQSSAQILFYNPDAVTLSSSSTNVVIDAPAHPSGKVASKFYDTKTGSDVTTSGHFGDSKRKHQLGSMAQITLDNEAQILRDAEARRNNRQAMRRQYGW